MQASSSISLGLLLILVGIKDKQTQTDSCVLLRVFSISVLLAWIKHKTSLFLLNSGRGRISATEIIFKKVL